MLILDKRKRREGFHVSELREVEEAALYRKRKERINHKLSSPTFDFSFS